MTDEVSGEASWVGYLDKAIKQTRSLPIWSSIPWFVGWATLTVMGPVVAARLMYRVVQSMVSRMVFGDSALLGKVILVTGASSGLGEALAHALYKRGARLILASRNTDKLGELKEILLKTYKTPELHVPTVVKLDLEDLNSIPVVADRILKTHGHIDVLINNAGISFRGAALNTDISVDIKLMVVNYFGQVALTKAILPSMVEKQSGHIVAVGSVQGKLALPYRACYSASKHALQAFFDSLRAEVANSKVRVSVVSPGYIATNLSINAVTGDGSKYGTMDAATASGMTPETVAEQIVGCLLSGSEELVVASLPHQLAIILRTLSPALVSRIMKSRAMNQKDLYLHKED